MKKLLFTALFSLAALCSPAQAPLVGDGGHYDTATHETLFLFVASPDAKKPVLRLYKEGMGGKPVRTVRLKRQAPFDCVWSATLRGDWRGYYYTLDISGNRKQWVETPGIGARAVGVWAPPIRRDGRTTKGCRSGRPPTSSSTRCTTATSPSPATSTSTPT